MMVNAKKITIDPGSMKMDVKILRYARITQGIKKTEMNQKIPRQKSRNPSQKSEMHLKTCRGDTIGRRFDEEEI